MEMDWTHTFKIERNFWKKVTGLESAGQMEKQFEKDSQRNGDYGKIFGRDKTFGQQTDQMENI